jgi:hypothetical protein
MLLRAPCCRLADVRGAAYSPDPGGGLRGTTRGEGGSGLESAKVVELAFAGVRGCDTSV